MEDGVGVYWLGVFDVVLVVGFEDDRLVVVCYYYYGVG